VKHPTHGEIYSMKNMGWIRHVLHMGETWSVHKTLHETPAETRPFQRLKHIEEDNIKMNYM
jgi:hypothetical protein